MLEEAGTCCPRLSCSESCQVAELPYPVAPWTRMAHHVRYEYALTPGKDATEAFEDVGHSDEARAMLTKMYLGDFKGEVSCGWLHHILIASLFREPQGAVGGRRD